MRQTYVDAFTNVDQHYSYDSAGFISHAELSGAGTDFQYASGHVATATTGATSKRFTYDPDTRWRTQMSVGSTTTAYSYDDAGHLTDIAVNGSAVASFTYDASGQRLTSNLKFGNTWTHADYTYDGLTLLSVAATQTTGGSTTATYTISYARSADGRPYAGVYQGSYSPNPTLFRMSTNDRGDVIALYDAAGEAFSWYRYDAWGNSLGNAPNTGTSLISGSLATRIAGWQPLRYAGYVYDDQTGLYYCSARYYDPATYQWTTPDPAKADGEESAYQYCSGDPVGKTDPSGREALNYAMNEWERALCNSSILNWIRGWSAKADAQVAFNWALSIYHEYSCTHDLRGDAFRHALWNFLMVRDCGAWFAEAFASAHEMKNRLDAHDKAAREMDLYNNSVGRALACGGTGFPGHGFV